MTKHTPGPWTLCDEGPQFQIAVRPHRPDDGRLTGFLLASIPREGPDAGMYRTVGGTDLGNARLIAAAPDLLDACKKALGVLGRQGYGDGTLCDELAGSIRKAEGGS